MSKPRLFSRRWCFAHRVELASLIGGVGFLFYLWSGDSLLRDAARWLQVEHDAFVRGGYWLLAAINVVASIIRIWAGGTLGGARMMAVDVQTDGLITGGPYRHVRNPIYLADILTLAGMALVVPWPGAVLVCLLLPATYLAVMSYEEERLTAELGEPYVEFKQAVPRLAWKFAPWRDGRGGGAFSWREGLENNFIYLPLVPGFVVCAVTGVLWHGVLVGAIGPVGWVALHFWRNFKPGGLARREGHDENHAS
ncbi:MAG: isoprenylcysteine carboxylmethyltransferase family protein [Candidatus Lernaella stagnicola]|nr:isoprenylcysteine carboxylmethyltransferase family protein [Candidatus Lernaella stagnicola]